MAQHDVFSLSCLTCVTTERVSASGADLVGTLRAFFVRHGECQTSIDLADARPAVASHVRD